MKIIICAIRDRALDAFQQPFYVHTAAQAIRAFHDGLGSDPTLQKHPDDYDLYQIGTWDDHSGTMENEPNGPKQLALGKQSAMKLRPDTSDGLTLRMPKIEG